MNQESDEVPSIETTRECKDCHEVLPLASFFRDRWWYKTRCKTCYGDARRARDAETRKILRGEA